jgi:hypothetical protein
MNETLQQALYIIITGCATALVSFICAYVNAKTKQLINNKYINSAIESVTDAVNTVTQTYVDAIKRDGAFTKEAQDEAKKKAIEIAETLITVDAQKAINETYGDFSKWLDSKIESTISANKQ